MTFRVPDLKRVREALEYIVENFSPAQRAAVRTVIEYEQDELRIARQPEMLGLPADIAHAQRSHKEGEYNGLETALEDITNIDILRSKIERIDALTQTDQEGNPDEDA